MTVHQATDISALSQQLAEWIVDHIVHTLKTQDRYTWALSGGSTPKRLYDLLALEPFRAQIPWEKIHAFWGDERYVPFEDPQNNGRMAFDSLLSRVPIPADQIHYMDTSLPPEESALKYEQLLHTYFNAQPNTFDLVLLGMGDDGHTLSLFPGTAVVHEQRAWVTAPYVEKQQMYRITLTAPVVNKAAAVAFLATGEGKADILEQVIDGPYNPDRFPSQQIKPANGHLHWFLDQAAAAQLVHR